MDTLENGRLAQPLAHVPRAWRLESQGLHEDIVLLSLQSVFLFTVFSAKRLRISFGQRQVNVCVLLNRTFPARAHRPALRFVY